MTNTNNNASNPNNATNLVIMTNTYNRLVIVDIMRQLQIDYDLEATDITDPNPVAMILLVNHLREILPKYKPPNPTSGSSTVGQTNEVVFEACLGEAQTKTIELKNKFKRTLQYRLKVLVVVTANYEVAISKYIIHYT